MRNISFHSSIADCLQSFIDYKRALGYKYESEVYTLHRFDDYWEERYGSETAITKESLAGWVEKKPNESTSSRSARISVVRQFAFFMNGMGKESYVPMEKYVKDHPVIHILSSEEIIALFHAIDEYTPKRYPIFSIRMRTEYKVLFRLILTTGLRRSEAASIRVSDVDWVNGVIAINEAKGCKDRLVYMSSDMTELLREYRDYLFGFLKNETEWLFPSFDTDQHVSSSALGAKFKFFWSLTQYSGTCEKDPTLHSLRHTYVVFRINLWISKGYDTKLMLPYLSRQLGHKSPNETFYYYHQVRDSFRIIQEKDSLSPDVIPEVRIR